MKRVGLTLGIAVCLFGSMAWSSSNLPTLNVVQILPLPSDEYLVRVGGKAPLNLEVTQHNGYSALWFGGACFNNRLFDGAGALKPEGYVRPGAATVVLQRAKAGCWLEFQESKPVVFHVVGNSDAFLAQAARLLPLYPQWSVKQPTVQASHKYGQQAVNTAYQAFSDGQENQAAASLERVFLTTPNPPESLYNLLGALYLDRKDKLKALCLYAQGAKPYPQTLGLRYAALLYHLRQPDKAIHVLNDTLAAPGLSGDNAAQAEYMLGSLYAEQQKYTDAIPHLRRAAGTYQDNPVILYNLAVSYQGAQQPDMALAAYERALPVASPTLAPDIRARITALKQAQVIQFNNNGS